MNYYPFHIGDYLSATRHLSWEEDAAYRRLLDTYYTTEKPLPTDLRAVCRLVLATTEAQREAVRVVLEEFFQPTAEGWTNSRADTEIAAMRDKQQKQRDKAAKRWAKPPQELTDAPAMPQHHQEDAAASIFDADAMPPTPTPTPTPTPDTKTARKRAAPVALVSVSDLTAAGVDPRHAADWLAVRKVKKLPLTATAWEETQAEAIKAGLLIGAAIQVAAANGWAGFKASWLAQPDAPKWQAPAAITTPTTDRRADSFLAEQDKRAVMATKPPAAILALAGKAVERAA